MNREQLCAKREEALRQFQIEGRCLECKAYGSGHINDTFLVVTELENQEKKRYIFQRMNHEIFQNPEELMENILGVTSYLRKKIQEQGGDPERETLNVIPTKENKNFYMDSIGSYWRMYQFIEDATSFDQVEKPEDFYESAVAFGTFSRLLADYPAATLHETIVNFHNTSDRFLLLEEAVKKDRMGRAKLVEKEISFAMERKADAELLGKMLVKGELPLRVTHNDTKLNNIMIDNKTGKGICVIDLDTVMPGLSLYDFGDSIRFGANTAAEDETDLSKVSCDLELFELYTKGYMKGCGGCLTEKEKEFMPMGAKVMTFECGMRFLTDYLQGDTYFKIHRENQNLDRCRTQFKLVADMEEKWDKMRKIVQNCKQ